MSKEIMVVDTFCAAISRILWIFWMVAMWKFGERPLNWNLFNCQRMFVDILRYLFKHEHDDATDHYGTHILGSKAFKPPNIGNDEGDDDDDDDDDVLHEQSLSAPTTFGGPGRLRITSFASWDLATMAWKIYLDIYPKPWPMDFDVTKIYPTYNDSIKVHLFLWLHLIFMIIVHHPYPEELVSSPTSFSFTAVCIRLTLEFSLRCICIFFVLN